MAKSIEKKMLPAEENASRPNIDIHDIEPFKKDAESLNQKISEVAYEIFLKRGAGHGNDLGDWLEAERIVLAEFQSNE